MRQRLGVFATAREAGSLVWVHGASIGEAKAGLPLVQRLASATNILFTTATLSSQDILRSSVRTNRRLEHTSLTLFGLDLPNSVMRCLDWWSPDAVVMLESEIWPHFLMQCRRRNIPIALLNARISDRSFRRWRRFSSAFKTLMGTFNSIHARTLLDCARLQLLSAPKALTVLGDLKFLAEPLPYNAAEMVHLAPYFIGRPVWLAASTHPGEEEIVLQTHHKLAAKFPDLLTVVVPRHPERGPRLEKELNADRRAAGKMPPVRGLWIADTYGELGLWFRLIPIVFVGKSLVPHGGGQNALEPARLACAVAVGPETANFLEHVSFLKKAGALTEVADGDQLADFVERMLSTPHHRRRVGELAADAVCSLDAKVSDYWHDAIEPLLPANR
ncbi:MAG TPA: glycosyltransferase N-terminal domain-containing protein [Rhodopila sp.]|uniref:3-deoxy-D-manno-octulosonic acid transferase n=1 Tax=Rhodopila sp. TaxID=2480087 RepID=UPI002BF7AFFE|nr:glycosyltransferase N-terminal domain-containing protein [Rhodopila sp.]HVY15233.1 glycosyltransferase N-terminal domain-containing protein [Rhodopila sp.]